MPRSKRKKSSRAKTRPRLELRHPELWGLGLVALGLFLASVVYVGWNGGYVGGALADGFHALLGGAVYALPVGFVAVGGLMVVRSALIDFRPFRAGLIVVVAGLMIALGRDQGGYFGQVLGGAVGIAIGATGSTILGILLLARRRAAPLGRLARRDPPPHRPSDAPAGQAAPPPRAAARAPARNVGRPDPDGAADEEGEAGRCRGGVPRRHRARAARAVAALLTPSPRRSSPSRSSSSRT